MLHNNGIDIACFTLPKIKEEEKDIQDAFSFNEDRTMIAIADGASSSLHPQKWADLLVTNFCQVQVESIEQIYKNWQRWLQPLQKEWFNYFQDIQNDPNIDWYNKGTQSKNFGSSTFVGLKLHPTNHSSQNLWECLAIGDSCLFQIKSNQPIVSFPINRSTDFYSYSECFHSLATHNQASNPKFYRDYYSRGDIFLLATDALAEWILKDLENGGQRWPKLLSLQSQQEFVNFITQLRSDRLIKNDDTTLCRLTVRAIPQRQFPQAMYGGNNHNTTAIVIADNSNSYTAKEDTPVPQKPQSLPIAEQLNSVSKSILQLKIWLFLSIILIASISFLTLLSNVVNLITLRDTIQNNDLNKILIPIYNADTKNDQSSQPIGFVWREYFNDNSSKAKNVGLLINNGDSKLPIDNQKSIVSVPIESHKAALYKDKNEVGYLLPGNYKFTPKNDNRLEIQVKLGE